MKFTFLAVCSILIDLAEDTDANSVSKKKKKIQSPINIESEEEENKSLLLVDLIEKALDSKEDVSVSFIKPHDKKSTKAENKKKPKIANQKTTIKHKHRRSLLHQKTYATPLENDIQARLLQQTKGSKKIVEPKENIVKNRSGGDTTDEDENEVLLGDELTAPGDSLANQGDETGNTEQADNVVNRNANQADDNSSGNDNRRKNDLLDKILAGSVEDETIEDDDSGGRKALVKNRKMEDVYRYENDPLQKMLLWLVINSVNPLVKNAVRASKTSIDKYVKHTVVKAGAQAALRNTDYTSIRFDKDRIMMYCGGQMYVYTTLRDSKICYNGQVHEVRLI